MSNTIRATFALAALFATLPDATQAQQIGDQIVVIRDGAEIKTGRSVLEMTNIGWTFSVRGVKEGWFWVENAKAGWISARDVVVLDQAPAYFSQRISENPLNAAYRRQRALAYLALGK